MCGPFQHHRDVRDLELRYNRGFKLKCIPDLAHSIHMVIRRVSARVQEPVRYQHRVLEVAHGTSKDSVLVSCRLSHFVI